MTDYLSWFVNREKQYQGFLKMLAGETTKTVMMIESQADMGKTWVVQRMRVYCDEHAIPVMHVDFRDRRPYDYLALVRLARDQMGPEAFVKLTETINNFTGVNININAGAGGINVSNMQQSSLSAGGDIAGGSIIKDNQFTITADTEMARRAAELQINDAFFGGLQELLADRKGVFLFDSYEDVTTEADRWIRDYLLLQVREKNLSNAIVVIAGQKTPDPEGALKPLVAKTGLDLFTQDHVREYIIDRRKIMGLDIETVFKTSGGFPGLLAKMADVAALETESDDDWL